MNNKYDKVVAPKDRIAEALRLREMKPAELSEKSGISKPSISCYLSGKYEPKQEALYKMGSVLGVSEMWLAGYDIPRERTAEQKRNDDLVKVIAQLRKDAEFFDVVSMLAELPTEQYTSIKSLISALGQK